MDSHQPTRIDTNTIYFHCFDERVHMIKPWLILLLWGIEMGFDTDNFVDIAEQTMNLKTGMNDARKSLHTFAFLSWIHRWIRECKDW
jgi:hypothetical protein